MEWQNPKSIELGKENSHSSIVSCSYQFKMTLRLKNRIFQCLNLKYDKHCKKKKL